MAGGGKGGSSTGIPNVGKGQDPSQGGVSAGQQGLADYTRAENTIHNAQAFSQVPMSTMHTMADVGAQFGWAQQLQQMSQADAGAANAFNQQQKSQASSGIGSLGSLLGNLG